MKPLLLHVVYRFDTGGLENGVVNLINRLDAYRHAVLALDVCVPAFCARVTRPDVEFISLHKPPGQTLKLAPRFLSELRRLQPDLIHTRNLAALEMQLPSWWWGRAARVHGEHGRDADDLHGTVRRYQWMRRAFRPFVQRYVALSGELEQYLVEKVGVGPARIQRICNGVDTERFQPAAQREPVDGSPFNAPGLFVVGSVGRMQAVKGHRHLVDAFALVLQREPALRERLRLVIVGGGPQQQACLEQLAAAGLADLAWLPGERRDVPALLRHFSCYAMPSLAEGISNTVLEALASGLPVLATRVGGNPELVDDGQTGALVPAADPEALATPLQRWAQDAALCQRMAQAARQQAEQRFSLQRMVDAYDGLYREMLTARTP